MSDLDSLLEIAKSAALIAGDYLKEQQTKNLKILSNKARDLKLQIDIDAEEIIKEHITQKNSFPILAEESGISEELGDLFWVIDPLDGTSNFLRNIPISCVAIAVMHKSVPVLGVINDFNNNNLYFAHQEMPAFMNNDQISVSNIASSSEGTLVTGIPAKETYTDAEFHAMITKFQSWKKVRMIGSAAMASAYVASGRADVYEEHGIFLWDIASGAAIVKAAGGNVDISNIQKDYRVDAKFSNSYIK